MARTTTTASRDTSIRTYQAKRDFTRTQEPPPSRARHDTHAPIFVVQKHQAHRAGLHYDFRLEHDGVLWSWAVRKGPSLDPSVKHIAAHVEDHPLDYADFAGTIPEGQYGAGGVEIWDRGTWEPVNDPDQGMRKGELTFVLHGTRLNGRFHLVRLRPRPGSRSKADNWLLFKGHDEAERAGADADEIERSTPAPRPARADIANLAKYGKVKRDLADPNQPPAPGAKRAPLPKTLSPQLCAVAEDPPEAGDWISEIKFDGYRLLCWNDHGTARLVTRNGHDWTDRLPALAKAIAALDVDAALLDGELVALDKDGASSFPALQAALSAGRDNTLIFYVFDLLYLDGWDLRPCGLLDRKRVLQGLDTWRGMLRYSDHYAGDPGAMRRQACEMKLEGIVCKQAHAPYQPGRGHGWVKVKCQGREEFVVLGWTAPRGSRTGLGALHLGYYDPQHRLHYAGGVGTGFSDDELGRLREKLDGLADDPPPGLVVAGDPLDKGIRWVRPELVAEVQYVSWSGSGRVRQAVYLGLREDKTAGEVVRDVANPEAEHKPVTPRQASGATHRPRIAVPPKAGARYAAAARTSSAIVTARKPKPRNAVLEGITITHPDRELWPGISKEQLAEYWEAVADRALAGIARRPLAVVRCPEGIGGEHFFQKHGHGHLPDAIRTGEAGGQPYLAIDDIHGLIAMAQVSAIELHAWGAPEADPERPDRMVFDLDPGEGVDFAEVVRAAKDVRDRLERLGLQSFCRTTGGKGLHVVAPLAPKAGWDEVKRFCRAFAETLSEEQPERFLSTVKKIDRRGRILFDWLRNGLGATAVASFSPRARPGATVATPLAWDEVTPGLDPSGFTLATVPQRVARQRSDPWQDFAALQQELPALSSKSADRAAQPPQQGKQAAGKTVIVSARKPKKRAQV
ncbi:MAG TPA: DNA ligase D [Acetobacteraceae bacterium]|nr:DNA ligase D [Acetobacteraceae bacterium]